MTTRTLADFLNAAGVKVAAAQSATQPSKKADVAQTVSTATTDASSQPAAEPVGGKAPRKTNQEPAVQDTKNAAQLWLAEHGVDVKDAKVAEALVAQQLKIAEAQKFAELEKLAEEERCRGAIFYQGMVKESTAMQLALGQCDLKTAELTAVLTGVPLDAIVKRAEEMAAAVGYPAFVGTDLGRAARTNDSRLMQAAAQNGNTTAFYPEAVGETRQPVAGQDENTMRFVDVWTLPGNPGLNNGQAVDQGKG
jgi:hypothetical protein